MSIRSLPTGNRTSLVVNPVILTMIAVLAVLAVLTGLVVVGEIVVVLIDGDTPYINKATQWSFRCGDQSDGSNPGSSGSSLTYCVTKISIRNYIELHSGFLCLACFLYSAFAAWLLALIMEFLRSTSAASPFGPSSFGPSSSVPTSVEPDSEDSLAQLAKEEVEHKVFTSSQGLRNILGRRRRELQQNTNQSQYLVFTSVPQALSDRLGDDISLTSKSCRFYFNQKTAVLIAKLMVRPAHELAARSFDMLVWLELHAINFQDHLKPFGSTRFTIGNWSKEADCCWSPISSTERQPSLVVEVGLSESTQQLALSARHWVESMPSVSIAIVIAIDRRRPQIALHRWEPGPRVPGVLTRSSRLQAYRTASIQLCRTDNETVIIGGAGVDVSTTTTTQLELPLDKLLTWPPSQSIERSLVIPEQKLKCFAEDIWRVQGLL